MLDIEAIYMCMSMFPRAGIGAMINKANTTVVRRIVIYKKYYIELGKDYHVASYQEERVRTGHLCVMQNDRRTWLRLTIL